MINFHNAPLSSQSDRAYYCSHIIKLRNVRCRVRPSNSGCTRIFGRARRYRKSISSYLTAVPTIQVHPELDGRRIDIVHCFYEIPRHFSCRKVAFFCTDQIANSAHARARVVFTGSTFALLIFRRSRCFCNYFRQKSSKSWRNPKSNVRW